MCGKSRSKLQRSRAAGKVSQQMLELRLESGIRFRELVGALKLEEGHHERFGNIAAAIGTEAPWSSGCRLKWCAHPSLQLSIIDLKDLFSLRPADFPNEFTKPVMMLLARAGFHSAGHINPIRAHDANRRRHVFDFQATRQNNTVRERRAPGGIPIRGTARTTILAGVGGVEQESKSAGVFVQGCEGKLGLDAKGLDDGSCGSNAGNEIGRFVTVKLDGIELERFSKCNDVSRRRVDENTDSLHSFGKLRADLCGFFWCNVARAFFVKIKT